jgi:dTDP-L-rhamnose 4-epimerase
MVILVTGGAGFVGSRIVDRLVAGGHEVRVVDLLHPDAHATVPGYLAPGAEYRFGDLRNPDVTADAVRGVDAVCHQASMVGLGVDFADVTRYVEHNDLATAVLLHALHDTGFRGRFVLASSMVVYGEGRYRCASHGIVGAPPRDPRRIAAGEFEPR